MPTFYVHIEMPDCVVRDQEGVEAPCLDAMCDDTIKAIRDMVAAEVLTGAVDFRGRAMICDASDQLLTIVAYHDAVCVRTL